jgi:hypothetical protein
MSTPSLLNIPYVIKAGTLYSQIPETGAGDFVVTRATTPTANRSTRINADGLLELVNDNVPRLDYPVGGAVNGCPALLVEPAATNSNPNSNTFSVETAPVATVVQNQVDPFGNPNSAWLMSGADSASDSASANNVRIIQSGLASNIYTCSIYIKSPTGSPVTFRYRQTAGGVISGSTVVSGSGFQRIQLTSPNTDTSSRFIIYTTGGEPIIISCHQLETGTVATSYIPTTTVAITRAADVINKTSIASLIGQTEGTIYAEVDISAFVTGKRLVELSNGSAANRMVISVQGSLIQFLVQNASSTQATIDSATLSAGRFKVAAAYASNDFVFYVNGVKAGEDFIGTVPTLNQINIGSTWNSILQFNDRIRAAAIYPNRLTNAQLQTLTTP